VVATIDLTDARAGVRVFPLTADHISVPLGVQVLSVDPSAVSLTLEKSGFAQVPVKPTIDGDPAPGFEVAETICEPKSVEVAGPESHLRDRPTAITERISIEGAQAPITETVNMAVSDPALRLREVRTARVTVRIVPGPVARFPDQQVQFKNLPAGRQVDATPPLVSVTLRGKPNALSGLKDKPLDPYVDVAGLGAGRYTLPVRVSTHDDIVVTAIEPSTVTVRIR
jgi:YbbR domain-containing protein